MRRFSWPRFLGLLAVATLSLACFTVSAARAQDGDELKRLETQYQAQSAKGDYAESLHTAKRFIRQQDKWSSPYYWGTIVLVGIQ